MTTGQPQARTQRRDQVTLVVTVRAVAIAACMASGAMGTGCVSTGSVKASLGVRGVQVEPMGVPGGTLVAGTVVDTTPLARAARAGE
ncbi:MAG: hypothetical protein ACTS3F_08895 [Phycisphaerales bacterium]